MDEIPLTEDRVPFQLQQLLTDHHIAELKPIQQDAIHHGLFRNKNLLISSPSGSGKTLIGLLALANHLIKSTMTTALFIVPYRALANEKAQAFRHFFASQHITVKAITGDTTADDSSLTDVDLIITTYEKCDTLLRQKHPFLLSLGCIVFDEIHEISTPSRGPRIELLLIRLMLAHPTIQYIFLSATIGNEVEFCAWLNTIGPNVMRVHSDRRPVTLNYAIELYKDKLATLKELLLPRIQNHHQILIFVNRRKDCISLAEKLAKIVESTLTQTDRNHCLKGYKELIRTKSYAQPLKEVIKSGIAYHNASLRATDREIVEQLFIHKHVKVLVATTTLAAGINTPAHTVIITDIIQHRKIRDYTNEELHDPTTVIFPNKTGIYRPLSPNQLFQMLGRAGRMGFEENGGDAIIMVRDLDEFDYTRFTYFHAPRKDRPDLDMVLQPKYKDLQSYLYGKANMEELILLLLAERSPCTLSDIRTVLQKSLYWFQFAKQSPSVLEKFTLDQIFQISSMDFDLLLKVYGQPPSENPRHVVQSLRINKDTAFEVRFSILYPKDTFHGTFHDRHGFSCSCQHTMRLELFKPVHQQQKPYFCRHLTDFLMACQENTVSKTTSQRVLRIIGRSVKHFNILQTLLRDHFIAQHPWEAKFSLSTLGVLAVKLYLYPMELTWIRQSVIGYGFSTLEFQLHKAVEFYCLRNHYHPDTLVPVITAYINEFTVDYIKKQFPKFGAGDIFSLINELARITGLFQRVALFENKLETARKFEILGYRITHGVKSELIDLMEHFPNMSRNKARILFESGITSSHQFRETGIHDLHAKTQLDLAQIVDLKNPVKLPPVQTTITSFFSQANDPNPN